MFARIFWLIPAYKNYRKAAIAPNILVLSLALGILSLGLITLATCLYLVKEDPESLLLPVRVFGGIGVAFYIVGGITHYIYDKNRSKDKNKEVSE